MKTEDGKVEEAGCAPLRSQVRKKHKRGDTRGSTELAIVVPRPSWSQIFLGIHRKTYRRSPV
jgi:hypothetical protein